MTCFWTGLMTKIKPSEINKVLSPKCAYVTMTETLFISLLKNNACTTIDVLWNNEDLSLNQMQENLVWVQNYDVSGIHGGHDCSTCDPFLLLISQLFVVNLIHNYNGKQITYTNKCNVVGRTLNFSSDTGHFW